MNRKLIKDAVCEYRDCEKLADNIVFSRNEDKVLLCCDAHADIVQDEGNPEYWDTCMNCGCRNPIN